MATLRTPNRGVDSSIRMANLLSSDMARANKGLHDCSPPGPWSPNRNASGFNFIVPRGLSPVKARIELIKRQHHTDDLLELNRHLKILVRDSGKKLQTTQERQRAGRDGRGDVT